jgi:hypothetical protein
MSCPRVSTVGKPLLLHTRKEILHDTADMKKHWIKVLCNGMKKPTSRAGEAGDRIHRCIAIEKKILKKTHLGMMGFSSSDDEAASEGGGDCGRKCPAG